MRDSTASIWADSSPVCIQLLTNHLIFHSPAVQPQKDILLSSFILAPTFVSLPLCIVNCCLHSSVCFVSCVLLSSSPYLPHSISIISSVLIALLPCSISSHREHRKFYLVYRGPQSIHTIWRLISSFCCRKCPLLLRSTRRGMQSNWIEWRRQSESNFHTTVTILSQASE